MASVKGFQMKNVRRTLGREGYGYLGTLYLNGKKIGTYEDYGDGAPENVEYVSKEAEKEMMELIISYAKDHPDEYIANLYRERPEQYKNECERFKKFYPYIDEKDITIETMSSNSIVFIVQDFLELYENEKQYKKYLKKGYRAIGVKGNCVSAYPASWTDEQINESAKAENETVYMSLEDFVK